MKVIRRKADEGGAATPAAPAATMAPKAAAVAKVLHRAVVPPSADPVALKAKADSAKVATLLERLTLGAEGDAHTDGKTDLAGVVAATGFATLRASGLLPRLLEEAASPDAAAREAALLSLAQLCAAVGRPAEPYVVPALPALLAAHADKAPAVRAAAAEASRAVLRVLCPHAVELELPVLLDATSEAQKWQTREGALRLLAVLADVAPAQVSAALPDIVPIVTSTLADPREQVRAASAAAGEATYSLVGNRDISHLVYDLLHVVTRPEEVADVVGKLSATTFVQAVEAPALAVMVPLLMRGLREETPVRRKACVIITNMAKLVSSPADAAKFLPRLIPGVEQVARAAADPELRDVAGAAMLLLERAQKEGEAAAAEGEAARLTPAECEAMLRDTIALTHEACDARVDDTTLAYVASLAALLAGQRLFDFDEWRDAVVPYLAAGANGGSGASVADGGTTSMSEAAAEACCRALLSKVTAAVLKDGKSEDLGWEDAPGDEGHVELCNCRFSLAYGGKILLNGATLRLLRGRRYGLCGANGVGKSTLMRAISRGQLDGFPPAEQLRTVYVEHDIQASLADLNIVDYIVADAAFNGELSTADAAATLSSVGFSAALQASPITSLSGGWKMKLALARAMLLKADILLLDEPTNHLDVTNVAWLQDWLVGQTGVTAMIVSHDSGFLDAVCTDIVHYEVRQLKRYPGNLSKFVEAVPAAQSYYELEAATLRFRFPTPGLLDGISSKEKPICKLSGVSFSYPGAASPQLSDVNVMCRLSSRIAVLGANGAGKSTLIKIITGEHKATTGQTWRHPNLRLAYVAQHAFHHISDHLDTTPLKYLFKRFGGGDDKEDDHKVDRQSEEEDKAKMAAATWQFDGQTRRFDKIVGRRKKKKGFEYEVQWQGLSSIKYNRWIPRDELADAGFVKFVNEFDGKRAAAAMGNDARPLTRANVEKFLSDFGLEPEFGVHSNIRGLSGGQKVKLVLAAAMWANPHLLIMDEPTNYLDRESLGALASAIKEFDGGVVLISHNSEFTSTCCNETWHVGGGEVRVVSKFEQAAGDEE